MTLWAWIATWFRQQPPAPNPPRPPQPDPKPYEPIVYLFDALNEIRTDHGLDLFEPDARLDNLAMSWAQSMQANNVLAHGDFAGRINKAYPNRLAGENIAEGQKTAEQVCTSWMNSPGHRANILNPDYVAAGCGRAGDFWTVDFLGA